MKSYVTSYNALFTRHAPDAPAVERIEIPLIQRDYAQGREGDAVARIRANFLDVLHEAVTTGTPISLDFIYGDVEKGTLRPLDGQQRLTTLFLLHWYLGWRADRLDQEQGWKRFSYATRASARLFCERLSGCKPPADMKVHAWIKDQHWFLHTWQHDPTIQSMLVMIEAIHKRFADADCATAWKRLVDTEAPAISFHLLPIEQMGLSEDLYIKMNSRGKPLTPFENFKARFEQVLEISCPDRVEEFAQKVDGAWADMLWPYRGSHDIVDDEFLRYFQFVTDVCEWPDGRLTSGTIAPLAERVYGPGNKKAAAHLDFLVRCFDTWVNADIPSVFSESFTLKPAPIDSDETGKVVLFGLQGSATVNLFAACCLGQVRSSWPRTLFLYAVLIHRLHGTDEFSRRLRVLRNLVEASSSELRSERMPALLADVRRLIVEGTLDGISAFNQAQVADERLKAEMITKAPTLARHLFHLEDHPVLRGSLAAFELDNEVFERRARAFHEVFTSENLPLLTGALLAAGDYSRSRNRRFFQFGSGSNLLQWREILAGASRAHLAGVREVLGRLLDDIAKREGDARSALESFTNRWLEATNEDGRDWRWYFVKYPEMRAGLSGIYAAVNGVMGYSVCMLDKSQMNSWYRDPYLSAIQREAGVLSAVDEPWFTGYETAPRWMRLKRSGTEIQCVRGGLLLCAPTAERHAETFSRVCAAHGIGPDLLLKVPQVDVGKHQFDTEDRVRLGAALVRDLASAGL
ncbi:DUF262 domain-containing protein [Corallococcus terminator]|uniref:DUF262 domain-containing protein n=1 Tax=Corallococcus terminator TaxID=2316733 RepID=A0A3A8HZT1_9BACT|nr:DUF262 domain-containing protein [Corallococcus terminator]RKG72970.1 DUF262 domain-containing protein [Corallococcus terminator]